MMKHWNKDCRQKIGLLLFCLFLVSCNQEENLLQKYDRLLRDVVNYNVYGYKQKSFNRGKDYFLKQGEIESTRGLYDFAILGKGFFRLIDRETEKYIFTRCGSFPLNINDIFYTKEGHTLFSEDNENNVSGIKEALKLNYKDKYVDINKGHSFNELALLSQTVEFTVDFTKKFKRYEIEHRTLYKVYEEKGKEGREEIYEFKLYYPKKVNDKQFNGNFFYFTDYEVDTESKIITSSMEKSTVDVNKTIAEMINILNKLKSKRIISEVKVEEKIELLLQIKKNIKLEKQLIMIKYVNELRLEDKM